jgi:hypothetical protein
VIDPRWPSGRGAGSSRADASSRSVKHLIFEETARASLKRGIDVLANAVRMTLGPKGHNAITGVRNERTS